MVRNYRKKPVVIQALEWNGVNIQEMEIFTGIKYIHIDLEDGSCTIPTLEGDHKGLVGDMIIRGIKGEYYPCKPGIFASTYESID